MNLRIAIPSACCVISVAVGSALAHHSFSAVFDLTKRSTLLGTLTTMDWRNPHIALSLEVKNKQGQVDTWLIEGMPPSFFRNRNVAKSDFEAAVGKTLTIEGVRARDGTLSILMLKVTFPDGKSVTTLDVPPPSARANP